MKVLVRSYCGVIFVAFKASELNKTCLTALLLFFRKSLIGKPIESLKENEGKWPLSPSYLTLYMYYD